MKELYKDKIWLVEKYVVNGRTLCESCHKKTDTFGNKLKFMEKNK